MKYLIDCGSHFFDGLKKLQHIYLFDNNWTIYSFEANPITYTKSQIYKPKINNLIHIHGAVSDYDGDTIVHCDHYQDWCGQGSNILKEPPKKDIIYSHNFIYNDYNVKTYNLPIFLEKLTDIELLVIKMDIEGEEYNILPKLIQNQTIKIDTIYIEFHERFFSDTQHYTDLKLSYIAALKNSGVNVVLWD